MRFAGLLTLLLSVPLPAFAEGEDGKILLLTASRDLAPGTQALAALGVSRADAILAELGGERLIAPLPPPTAGQMPGCNVGRYDDTRAIATGPAPSPSATTQDAGSAR